MADKTQNLGLIKPANGEYYNTWDAPTNKNWDTIDEILGGIQLETEDSRGTQSTLTARLDVSLNADGSLKDVPEIATARTSAVYGYSSGSTDFDLDARLEAGDREVFDARQGAAKLIDSLAFVADDNVHNCIVSAPTGFLSFTGAQVKVDGSVTDVVCNINGYKQVVRSLKSTTIAGAAGTYYVYLDLNLAGEIILDRTGVGQNTGVTGEYPTSSGKYGKFSDATQNFVNAGVEPGDILEITSTGSVNKGQYVVKSIISPTEVEVWGQFFSIQATLNYKFTNPLAPVLGATSTPHSLKWQRESGRIYIGRAVFDGSNVTSVSAYALKGRFSQFFSIGLIGGNFLQAVSHGLGYFPSKINLYASQANDYSQPLEPLSVSEVVGGTTALQRSVIVQTNDTLLQIKNATNGVFYRDFSGLTQIAGYLLVEVER